MMGSPKLRVVVRIGRGLSPGPPAQNSSALPTEIIVNGSKWAGEVSGGMHEDAASRNRVARDKRYTYSD